MYQHRISRICWSLFLLICAAFGGGVLWRLTLARQTQIPPRVEETVSPPAPQIQQKDESERSHDLAAINSDPGDNKRSGNSELNPKATHASSQQPDEILILGDPFRLALAGEWLEKPLVVRVKPGRQVTFVALDTGKFVNGKYTITLKTDASGLAVAPFYVDNEGGYRVLVSSPESDSEAEFSIQCVTREFRDSVRSGRHARRHLSRQREAEKQRAEDETEVNERIRRKRSGRQ